MEWLCVNNVAPTFLYVGCLKDKFTPKLKFSHFLLTLMPMERRVKKKIT